MEVVHSQPVTVLQIYEVKQDGVVQHDDLVSTLIYVFVKIDELGSVHYNNQQASSQRRLGASLAPPEWTGLDFSASNAR